MTPRNIPAVTSPIGGRPAGLAIDRQDGLLRVSFAWRCFDHAVLLAAATCWVAIPPMLLLPTGNPIADTLALAASLPGLLLGYVALAGLLNSTTIEVGPDAIRVRHHPIPWPAPAPVPTARIVQIYAHARDVSLRWGALVRVWAALDDGAHVPLTWYLRADRAAWATFVEREIEKHLGITDHPVLCPACGYDVRATPHRCPECGHRPRSTATKRRRWAKAAASLLGRRGRAAETKPRR